MFPVWGTRDTGTCWHKSSIKRVSSIGRGSFDLISILCNTAVAIIVTKVVGIWVRIPTDSTGNRLFQTPNVLSMTFLVPICAF